MEKYRRFADSFTGINPFLPVYLNKKIKNTEIAAKFLVGILLFVIRLPLLLLFAFTLFLFEAFFARFILVASIRRTATVLITSACTRAILFLLGFYSLQTSFKGLQSQTTKKSITPADAQIILVNHTSPVDHIFVKYLMSPVFTRILLTKKDPSSKQKVVLNTLNPSATIMAAFGLRSTLPLEGDAKELERQGYPSQTLSSLLQSTKKDKKGPVCLFFEGAKTNGAGVLTAEDSLLEALVEENTADVVLLNLRYTNKLHCSPINTTRHPLVHFMLMLSNFSNELKVSAKSLTLEQSPDILSANSTSSDIKPIRSAIYSFYESVGIKKMQATWREYKNFLEYWQQTKSESYIDDVKNR